MEPELKCAYENVVAGNRKDTEVAIARCITAGIASERILDEALISAMTEVGRRFSNSEIFIPEMLIAAMAMKTGLEVLRPKLVEAGVEPAGKVLMGTVSGDLHDIGKNLVAMMLEGAGFHVIDLGVDVSPAAFAQAVEEHQPQVIGLSALLTTTMENMVDTLNALAPLRIGNGVKVIIGGAPVTASFTDEIGADGYAADASSAVGLVRSLI